MSGDGSHLLVWAPAPCPRCRARTVDEAGTRCKPSSDETGEYFCPGDREDAAGNLLQPTAESIAAMDEFIELQFASEGQ